MNLSWLSAAQKVLTRAGALRSFSKHACALIARLFHINETIEGERLKNKLREIEVEQAFVALVEAHVKAMRGAGATRTEIREVMLHSLPPKLRVYLQTQGVETDGSASSRYASPSNFTVAVVEQMIDAASAPQSAHVERRRIRFAQPGKTYNKRVSDIRP